MEGALRLVFLSWRENFSNSHLYQMKMKESSTFDFKHLLDVKLALRVAFITTLIR